jgi:hypothetical protein
VAEVLVLLDRGQQDAGPVGIGRKASTIGRIDRSTMLSASITRTGSPSTKRAASPRASAMPPGRSW